VFGLGANHAIYYAQVIAQTSAANMCVEECASDLAELPVHVEERAIDYVVIYQMEKVITKGHYSVKPGKCPVKLVKVGLTRDSKVFTYRTRCSKVTVCHTRVW
jgi:hypothetical protein